MDVAEAGQFVIVMLAPTALVATGLLLPRAVRAVGRRVRQRRTDNLGRPSRPPIEQLAADVRRLLQRYEAVRQSADVAMRARHLRAIEAAIGDCASDAALALGLPVPDPDGAHALTTPQLRALLRALADAGLVLVPATGLLAADGHT